MIDPIERLKQGDDVRRNWRAVNALIERVRALEAEVRRLSAAVEDLRARARMRQPTGPTCARWA